MSGIGKVADAQTVKCEGYIDESCKKFNISGSTRAELWAQVAGLAEKHFEFVLKSRIKTLCKRINLVQSEFAKIRNVDVDDTIKQEFENIWKMGDGKLFCPSFNKKLSELKSRVIEINEKSKDRNLFDF